MMNGEHRAALWLAMHDMIGAVRGNALKRLAGSYEGIPELPPDEIGKLDIMTEKELEAYLSVRISEDRLSFMEERMERLDIRLVIPEDEEFPEKLKSLRDCPAWLFVKGKLPENGRPAAAVVGARNCTDYGKEQAEFFGRLLGRYGIQVVSGMAMGVDTKALQGAVREGGDAFAVLGNGVNICYPPSGRELYRRLSETGGILSEHLPDVPPLHWHFPARNRVISGLSDVVIVIEARKRSGSLITSDLALEQGRDVFALPGRWQDPLSEGCNRLIRVGAGIITDPSDILDYFHLRSDKAPRSKISGPKLAKNEKMVYSAIDSHPAHSEYIRERSGLSHAECMEALISLEMRGLIRQSDNQYYVRK